MNNEVEYIVIEKSIKFYNINSYDIKYDKIRINLCKLNNEILDKENIFSKYDIENKEIIFDAYFTGIKECKNIIFDPNFNMDKLMLQLNKTRYIRFQNIQINKLTFNTLPSNLERIIFTYNSVNNFYPIINTEYPDSIKECIIDFDGKQPFYKMNKNDINNEFILPSNLPTKCPIKLNLYLSQINESFYNLPINITEIYINTGEINITPLWPLCLRILKINMIHNADAISSDIKIPNLGILPYGLEEFEFKFIKYEHILLFPETLHTLYLSGILTQPESLNNLPDSIKYLTLGIKFSKCIEDLPDEYKIYQNILYKLPANCISFTSYYWTDIAIANLSSKYPHVKIYNNKYELPLTPRFKRAILIGNMPKQNKCQIL